MALKHTTQATGTNDGAKQVSKNAWNEGHTIDTDGLDFPIHASTPSAPAADNVRLFSRKVAGRVLPTIIGPTGLDASLQTFFGRDKIGIWSPGGNATTVPAIFGYPAGTVLSNGGTTATARNVATTNILTRARRLGFVSTATAGIFGGFRTGVAQWTVGTGGGLGGFFTVIRFGTADAATVSGARAFIGMSSSTAAPTNVEPSTLTNVIGIAQLSTDATQWYLVYGGSAAQTPIALGTSLGAPTLTNTIFELALFSSPNENGVVYYQVTNLGSGVSVSGTLGPGTAGTTLPANTTLLNHQIWRTNNATALAVGIDIVSIYIETAY